MVWSGASSQSHKCSLSCCCLSQISDQKPFTWVIFSLLPFYYATRLASRLCLLNKADWHFWKPFLMDQPHHHNLSSWMHKARRDLGAVLSHSFSSTEILADFSFPECQSPFCYCIKQHTSWCLFNLTPGRRQNCVPKTTISCALKAHNGPYIKTWKNPAKELPAPQIPIC